MTNLIENQSHPPLTQKTTRKKLEDYKKTQLPLPFIFPTPDKHYSNTVELYDAIPKYFWGRISASSRVDGRFLETMTRKFEFRCKAFTVKITPARIQEKTGIEKDYYPGKREELVEDALRKMACDGNGYFLDDQAGVIFSLNQLQKELKNMGHTYSITQIKNALLICQKTNILLESSDGSLTVSFQIFDTIGLRTWDDWQQSGNKTKCFVRFNTLVTRSIRSGTYRQLNYKACMTYKKNLSRWLHKRMAHLYTQAGWDTSYSILLSTIIRDSGTKRYQNLKDNLRGAREVLNEMIGTHVLSDFSEEKRYFGRKIIDVKFTLKPGYAFIRDTMQANKKKYSTSAVAQNGSSASLIATYPQK